MAARNVHGDQGNDDRVAVSCMCTCVHARVCVCPHAMSVEPPGLVCCEPWCAKVKLRNPGDAHHGL